MLWPDEIRTPEFGFLDEDVEVRPQELAMAGSLIDSLSGDFDPEQFHDSYREALEELIEAKVEGHELVAPATPKSDTGAVVDLMAALRASVDAAKKARGGAESKAAPSRGGAATARKAPKATKVTKPAAKKAASKAAKKPARKVAETRKQARKSA